MTTVASSERPDMKFRASGATRAASDFGAPAAKHGAQANEMATAAKTQVVVRAAILIISLPVPWARRRKRHESHAPQLGIFPRQLGKCNGQRRSNIGNRNREVPIDPVTSKNTKMNQSLLRTRRRYFLLFAATLTVGLWAPAVSAGDDPWPDIKKTVFPNREIKEDTASLQIFAPNQADDAAVVPVSIKIAPNVAPAVKSLTLVIDRNPVPVAATFAFGDLFRKGPDIGERTIATRLRVDAFSRVRAILETMNGTLHMASKFVIGSGGCSAPASRDPEDALAHMGKARLVVLRNSDNGDKWREARVMIRHPNFTGMQMNKKTGDYTPPRFVNFIEVRQGDHLLWQMEGGISISEDPNIRFTFGTDSPADLEFDARDTDGSRFKASGSIPPPS